MISSNRIRFNSNIELHLINFGDYDDSYKKMLDEYLSFICEGTKDKNKLKRVKIRISRYMNGKEKDPTKIAGWLAELYCHVYLNKKKYKPAFLFQNLEEQNSMKKGFDGFYIKNNKFFIYESKSNLPNEKQKFHLDGLKFAFNDIQTKIGGKNYNKKREPIDPWTNAIHHFKISNMKSSNILNQLDEILDNFFDDKFLDISECNVIPSSTIYLEDKYCEIDEAELKKNIINNIDFFRAKENILICINKKTYSYIQDYLNG